MSGVNGTPHPGAGDWLKPGAGLQGGGGGRHPGGRTCAGVLILMLAVPALLNGLLAGSAVAR